MRNIALLNKVMDHIEADPRHHDQSWWFYEDDCGTVACFAGWSVLLHHKRTAPMNVDVPAEAMALLGLNLDEATWMFNGQRTRNELRAQVDEWTAQALPVITEADHESVRDGELVNA